MSIQASGDERYDPVEIGYPHVDWAKNLNLDLDVRNMARLALWILGTNDVTWIDAEYPVMQRFITQTDFEFRGVYLRTIRNRWHELNLLLVTEQVGSSTIRSIPPLAVGKPASTVREVETYFLVNLQQLWIKYGFKPEFAAGIVYELLEQLVNAITPTAASTTQVITQLIGQAELLKAVDLSPKEWGLTIDVD